MNRQERARDTRAQRKKNEETARQNSEEAVRQARRTRQANVSGNDSMLGLFHESTRALTLRLSGSRASDVAGAC